jgi:hypothetical protein
LHDTQGVGSSNLPSPTMLRSASYAWHSHKEATQMEACPA